MRYTAKSNRVRQVADKLEDAVNNNPYLYMPDRWADVNWDAIVEKVFELEEKLP